MGEFIDVMPISWFQFLPDQIMDRFPFYRHYALALLSKDVTSCCNYIKDFDLAQKCAKQDRMYRGEKLKIE